MTGLDPDLILANRDFVRGLARALTRDAASADDASQDACVVALTRSPASPDAARSWLATIASRFALRARRDESLHAKLLDRMPRRDEPPTPEEVLVREDDRRRVVTALLELDEPYRTTLLLRWYRDLSPREIARVEKLPLDTVKTRLKRGLERLRRRLEGEYGGRDGLRACLAPLAFARPEVGTATIVVATGVLLMKPIAWVSAVAVLATATAFLFVLQRSTTTQPDPPPEAVIAPTEAPAISDSDVVSAVVQDPASREREAVAEAVQPEPALQPLAGVVLLPSGAGAAGAKVAAFEFDSGEHTILSGVQPPDRESGAPLAAGETDVAGRFSLPVGTAGAVQLRVLHDDYPAHRVTNWSTSAFVTVRLVPGCTVFGRVRRARDDSPLPGTRVQCLFRDDATRMLEVATDADGAYRFERVPAIPFSLRVKPPEGVLPGYSFVAPTPGETIQRDFAIEPGVTIRGMVTDKTTGLPIPGAEVGISLWFDHVAVADVAGRYELAGFGGSEQFRLNLQCRARGYGRSETPDLAVTPSDTEREIDFALLPAHRAIGRLVDADGAPVADARLTVIGNSSDPSRLGETWWHAPALRFDKRDGRSGADGSFAIDDLRPDIHHGLLAEHPRQGVLALDFPADELEVPVTDLGVITMPVARRIEGIVVDEQDRPLPNVHLWLDGAGDGRLSLSLQSKPWFENYLDSRGGSSRVDGRFAFHHVAPGDYELQAWVEGSTSRTSEKIRVDAAADPKPIVVEIRRGLSIQGRVVDETGDPPSVPLNLYASQLVTRASASANMHPDGSFEFSGLEPGDYSIRLLPFDDERLLETGAGFAITDVPGIAAGTRDLVLTLPACVSIRGRVLMGDGSPATDGLVYAFDADGKKITDTEIVTGGRFALRIAPGSTVSVEARVGKLSATFEEETKSPSRRARKENVEAGATGVELRLPEH